jgi:hypothetical protein
LTFAGIAQRQLRLLAQVCETLTARALAGQRSDLESLFLAQDHLEHWLQYLSPLALEAAASAVDAPPPLPSMRPAPPLSQNMASWSEEDDETTRPRVTFPPEPVWVEDLEREREDTP